MLKRFLLLLAVAAVALAQPVPSTNGGNAATANALAQTPTLCTTGQAPTGILANGNATGCAAPTASAHGTALLTITGTTISAHTFTGCISSVTRTSAGLYTMVVSGCPTNYFPLVSFYSSVGVTSVTAEFTAYTSTQLQVYLQNGSGGIDVAGNVFIYIP